MLKFIAWVAIVFGAVVGIGEAWRNWGDWQWWPFWLVDFIAAGLLIVGALLVIRQARGGQIFLSGAWGFSCAMFYMSFWSHIEVVDQPISGNMAHLPLTVVVGIMWAITVVSFIATLISRHDAQPDAVVDASAAPPRR